MTHPFRFVASLSTVVFSQQPRDRRTEICGTTSHKKEEPDKSNQSNLPHRTRCVGVTTLASQATDRTRPQQRFLPHLSLSLPLSFSASISLFCIQQLPTSTSHDIQTVSVGLIGQNHNHSHNYHHHHIIHHRGRFTVEVDRGPSAWSGEARWATEGSRRRSSERVCVGGLRLSALAGR